MAVLTIVETDVTIVRMDEKIGPLPVTAAIDKGEILRPDTTTGKWVAAIATTAGNIGNINGVAIKTAGGANIPVTVMRRGILHLGLGVLDGLAYDLPIFLDDTGALNTVAGTVSKIVGIVYPAWAQVVSATPDRVLYIDCTGALDA